MTFRYTAINAVNTLVESFNIYHEAQDRFIAYMEYRFNNPKHIRRQLRAYMKYTKSRRI